MWKSILFFVSIFHTYIDGAAAAVAYSFIVMLPKLNYYMQERIINAIVIKYSFRMDERESVRVSFWRLYFIVCFNKLLPTNDWAVFDYYIFTRRFSLFSFYFYSLFFFCVGFSHVFLSRFVIAIMRDVYYTSKCLLLVFSSICFGFIKRNNLM